MAIKPDKTIEKKQVSFSLKVELHIFHVPDLDHGQLYRKAQKNDESHFTIKTNDNVAYSLDIPMFSLSHCIPIVSLSIPIDLL